MDRLSRASKGQLPELDAVPVIACPVEAGVEESLCKPFVRDAADGKVVGGGCGGEHAVDEGGVASFEADEDGGGREGEACDGGEERVDEGRLVDGVCGDD
jgi:hypothetical protein